MQKTTRAKAKIQYKENQRRNDPSLENSLTKNQKPNTMNTTEYFTYINAMFLFCIFTCGLLFAVSWRLINKSDALKKEQDAHLKATNTNTLLNKALSAKNAGLQANECKLRDAEKEIRDLQAKLDHAESDRTTLEKMVNDLHQQLAASKRVRNAKGVFVRKDGTYTPKEKINRWDRFKVNSETLIAKELKAVKVKPLPTIGDEVDDEIIRGNGLTDAETVRIAEAIAAQPKPHTLRHGMTVKNPTEKEAKDIFEAARVAGCLSGNRVGRLNALCPHIWFYSEGNGFDGVSESYISDADDSRVYMTTSEFIARIKGEVG